MNTMIRSPFCLLSHLRTINTKFSQTALNTRSYSTAKKDPPAPKRDPPASLNDPIKFVGSTAHSWSAKKGRSGTGDFEDTPDIQTYAVVGSVAIFLIYFCILREENDIDEEMGKTLYERVPGLEQTQLVVNYKYNLENGIDNAAIVVRMKELDMRPEDIAL